MRHLPLFLFAGLLSACQTVPKIAPDPRIIELQNSRTTISAVHIYGNSEHISKDDLLQILILVDKRHTNYKTVFEIYASDKNHVSVHLTEDKKSLQGPILNFRRTSTGWILDDKEPKSYWII